MSKAITLSAITLGLTAAFSSFANEPLIDKAVSTENIRVSSYNIMASRMGDTDAIAEAVKSLNADIIGLQEVDNKTGRSGKNFSAAGHSPINQAEYIAKQLGMNYYFCKAIDHDGGEYGTAVLSKHPIKFVKRMELPNIEGAEQRSACAVEVDVPNYPAPVMAVTTHLDHTTQPLREEQVRTLQAKFSSWNFKHALPIIIGDLNLPPQSTEYKELTAWFNETDKALTLTAPAWNPDRKIDYILTSNAQEWDIKKVEIPKPMDKVASVPFAELTDHLPLTVEMQLVRQ